MVSTFGVSIFMIRPATGQAAHPETAPSAHCLKTDLPKARLCYMVNVQNSCDVAWDLKYAGITIFWAHSPLAVQRPVSGHPNPSCDADRHEGRVKVSKETDDAEPPQESGNSSSVSLMGLGSGHRALRAKPLFHALCKGARAWC